MKRVLSLLYAFMLLTICLLHANAQDQKKIFFRAELLEYDEAVLPDVERYSGNVIFRHDNTIGYCDRANHNRVTNQLEAFGNPVIVVSNDSIKLYGQRILYDGNARTVTVYQNVILKDNSAALYTDSLFYSMNDAMGYYLEGGKILNDSNVLTSRIGYYYTDKKMAYLYDSVRLTNSSYTVDCEKSSFNTGNSTVYFISRTHLVSDENEIFTDRGWYDTKRDLVTLAGNAELFNEDQVLTGDSLFYDKGRKFGQGWNNVQLLDVKDNSILQGNYVEFEEKSYATATDSSVMVYIYNADSLFLHADTLLLLLDTTNHPSWAYAFNHVKFFRYDMQGACDSMTYSFEDSLLTMFFNPVLWTGENQLTADTIFFYVVDSNNMRLELNHSAFISSSLFRETEFNQVKGLKIVGHIANRSLRRMDVIGNAECLYYILDEDSSLIGINSAMTSEMSILLDSNEIQSITFYNNPDGKLYPDKDLPKEDRLLKNFHWLNVYRPQKKEDIFVNPVERKPVEAIVSKKYGEEVVE